MRRHILLAILFFLAAGALRAQTPEEETSPTFAPIHVKKAVEPQYPVNSIANGVVVLKVVVTAAGAIYRVDVVHGIASLTEEAERTVRRWEFQPARRDGKRVESSTLVAFAFNTGNSPTSTEISAAKPGEAAFAPLQIVSALAAGYPFNSTAAASPQNFATVILEAAVDEKGEVSHVEVLRGVETLTGPAEEALRQWKFEPARFHGEPVASTLAASFTFRPPAWMNP